MRLLIVQQILPRYRTEFFDEVGRRGVTLTVAHGVPAANAGVVCSIAPYSAHLENRRFCGLVWQAGAVSVLRELAPDVVVVEASARNLTSLVIARIAERRDVGLVVWGLGQINRPRGRLTNWASRWMLGRMVRRAGAVVAYSNAAASFYRDALGTSCPVVVAPNAIAHSRANLGAPVEAKVGLGNPPILVFAGRIVKHKGIDRLLSAVHLVGRDRLQCTIVGEGPHREALQQQASDLGLGECVAFVGDMTPTEVANVMAQADYVVLPGMGGLAIQQAMSVGTPVILGAPCDGTELDLVVDGVTGFIAEHSTPAALARAIERALDRTDYGELRKQVADTCKAMGGVGAMATEFLRAATIARESAVVR